MSRSIAIARLIAAVTLSAPAIVCAQPTQPPQPPTDSLFFVTTGGPLNVDVAHNVVTASAPLRLDVLRGESVVPGGVVKDKPYSAESVTESTQVLADGNRITHGNQSRFYRDSQGRTRREQTVGTLGAFQSSSAAITMITIGDPVAGVTYFLDPSAHTARKLQPFHIAFGDGATFEQAVPPPGAPGGLALSGVIGNGESVRGAVGQTVTIMHGPGPGPLPGSPAERGGPVVESMSGADARNEDLGKQVLEGVLAHGTRETVTIPAGAVGNERPIEITSETWYSDDLAAVVLSKASDPRYGETSYRLVNVVRGEPAPDLFAVPEGYEVQTDPGPAHVGARVFGPGDAPPDGPRAERRAFLIQQGPQKQPQ